MAEGVPDQAHVLAGAARLRIRCGDVHAAPRELRQALLWPFSEPRPHQTLQTSLLLSALHVTRYQ